MKNIFNENDVEEIVQRIKKLSPQSQALWGKMNVSQMLAHCNVTYEMVYDDKHPKPSAFKRFVMTLLIKKIVVNEKAYKQGSRTGPQFMINDDRDFDKEKERLIDFLYKTQQLGETHFDGLESHSFGALNKKEWNNMFYKHLDHHLKQFGV